MDALRLFSAASECGAERSVNANQGFREYSPWGPTQAQQDQATREQQQRESMRRYRIALGDVAEARAYLVAATRSRIGQAAIRRAGYAAIIDAPDRGDDASTLPHRASHHYSREQEIMSRT